MSHRVNLFQLRKPQKFLGLLASLKKQNKYRGPFNVKLLRESTTCPVVTPPNNRNHKAKTIVKKPKWKT